MPCGSTSAYATASLFIALAVAGCGAGGGAEDSPSPTAVPGTGAGGPASPTAGPGGGAGGPASPTAGPGGGAGAPTTPTAGPVTPTGGPGTSAPAAQLDLYLQALQGCSYVPNGSISGIDSLTMFVGIQNTSPQQVDALVPYSISSDTGLQGSGRAVTSQGAAETPMQVVLRPEDFDRTHRFTAVADPGNEIPERDELNNTILIEVFMPSRPAVSQSIPCQVLR